MKAFLRLLTSCVAAACLASCTLGYRQAWEKAAATPATLQPQDLSGAWEGSWLNGPGSDLGSAHSGKLWAIATPIGKTKSGGTQYDFRYKATWGKIFRGVFTMEHETNGKDAKGQYVLSGQRDLGMFGIFTFTGTATPTEFHAKYQSKGNSGNFDLKRPERK